MRHRIPGFCPALPLLLNDWLYDWFWIPFLGSFNIRFWDHSTSRFWVYSRFREHYVFGFITPLPVAFNVPVFGYIREKTRTLFVAPFLSPVSEITPFS